MPVAKGRTTANKTITLPNGNTVLVPVITQLNVVDSVDRYQETDYTIINTVNNPTTNKPTTRQVHVDQIDETGNIDNSQAFPPGNSSLLPVERVDVWNVLDPVDRAQESDVTLFNDQANYNPSGPPFFTRHKATHVVRVQNDPDDGNYVDVELIDELDWVDSVDRGQETHLQLNQPQGTYDSTSGMYIITADSSDPDITDTSSGIDPPFRLDPFQNIVGYTTIQLAFSIGIQGTNTRGYATIVDSGQPTTDPTTGAATDPPLGPPPQPDPYGEIDYDCALSWSASSYVSASNGNGPTVIWAGLAGSAGLFTMYSVGITGISANETAAPLVINGKTIPGFTSQLTIPMQAIYQPMSPIQFSAIHHPLTGLGTGNNTWWNIFAGLRYYANQNVVSAGILTVSSAPFPVPFPSGGTANYQCIGMQASVDIGITRIALYCVRV